jgi:acyl-CoA dehydrogenase
MIDGEKVFITSGMRADWITMACEPVRRKPGWAHLDDPWCPATWPGLSRSKLDKMGWWCFRTPAHLRMDEVRGAGALSCSARRAAGFKIIMSNFNGERLGMSADGARLRAGPAYDEALDWARQRKAFGTALVEKQVIRHKLVDMQMRIASTQGLAGRGDGACRRREIGI